MKRRDGEREIRGRNAGEESEGHNRGRNRERKKEEEGDRGRVG